MNDLITKYNPRCRDRSWQRVFVLYGLWGIIYNDRFTDEKINAPKGSMEDIMDPGDGVSGPL